MTVVQNDRYTKRTVVLKIVFDTKMALISRILSNGHFQNNRYATRITVL